MRQVVNVDFVPYPFFELAKYAAMSQLGLIAWAYWWFPNALLNAGKSIDDMSSEHNRSPSAIMSRLHKNDLIEIRVK